VILDAQLAWGRRLAAVCLSRTKTLQASFVVPLGEPEEAGFASAAFHAFDVLLADAATLAGVLSDGPPRVARTRLAERVADVARRALAAPLAAEALPAAAAVRVALAGPARRVAVAAEARLHGVRGHALGPVPPGLAVLAVHAGGVVGALLADAPADHGVVAAGPRVPVAPALLAGPARPPRQLLPQGPAPLARRARRAVLAAALGRRGSLVAVELAAAGVAVAGASRDHPDVPGGIEAPPSVVGRPPGDLHDEADEPRQVLGAGDLGVDHPELGRVEAGVERGADRRGLVLVGLPHLQLSRISWRRRDAVADEAVLVGRGE